MVAIAAVAAIGILFDGPSLAANTRDWLLQRFGFGLLVLAGWALYALAVAWRGWHLNRAFFVRRTIGVAALGLFTWGLLGLNRADWSTGGVSFEQVTLGGDIGRAIVAGFLGKLAWLSLFILAAALLAPGPTRWVARNVPL
ncbi:MAG TPA: hypothetical protein PKD27_13135, partial [Tepidiformaceae bacterium]|nr:hypothetical protein [Tepidiformaceae bacterium]